MFHVFFESTTLFKNILKTKAQKISRYMKYENKFVSDVFYIQIFK